MTIDLFPRLMVFACGAVLASAALAAPTYRLVDLGVLPGTTSCYPDTITDDNVVTGRCGSGLGEAFRWTPASGMKRMTVQDPVIWARNNREQVVGQQRTSDGSGEYLVASRAQAPNYFLLGTWAEELAYLVGINNAGQVLGASVAGGEPRPWIWNRKTGLSEPITAPPGTTYAVTRMNDLGQVSGFIYGFCSDRAFIYDARSQDLRYIGPGNLPDEPSNCVLSNKATALNDVGQVVGYGNTSRVRDEDRPYIWSEDTGPVEMINRNPDWRSFYPTDINNQSQAVGVFTDGFTGSPRAFYWDKAGGISYVRDLIDSADPLKSKVYLFEHYPNGDVANLPAITESGSILIRGSYEPRRPFVDPDRIFLLVPRP